MPTAEEIAQVLQYSHSDQIILDGTTVTLHDARARIDLGGMAKGYSLDVMAEYLQKVQPQPEQVIVDPQAEANDFWAEVDQPDVGRIKLINSPTHFYEDPARIKGPAPQLAEHTDEVLGQLGYDSQAIGRLRDDKVIL